MITYRVLLKETPEIISLLEQTVWGMNGPLFSHKDIKHRIKSNPKNYYFCAFSKEELVGLVVCCERQGIVSEPITCVYTRYFTVKPTFRGLKIGENLLNSVEEYFEDRFKTEPVIFYAYQDKKNASSMKVAENKQFSIYSEFRTFTFSRISPIKTVAIEEEPFNTLLENKETAQNTEHIHHLEGSKSFVLRDKNEQIVCGARVLKSEWNVVKIPGWQGFLMKYVVSKLPYLKRLFNSKHFKFLALDHLTVSNGCDPKTVELFLEGILKLEKANICLLWADTKDSYYSVLNNLKKPGLLERLNSNVPACIRVEHRNLSGNHKKALEQKPFFISSADLT